MEFYEILRMLRSEKDVRQKDVADYIGVSERVYGFYEDGRFPKDPNVLKKLAEYFNVTTDYLLGRTESSELIVREYKKSEFHINKDAKYSDKDLDELMDFINNIKKKK